MYVSELVWSCRCVSLLTLRDCPCCEQDVVLTNGCLGAIQMAMWGLAGRGENILVPRPGFPVYEVTADAHNIEFRYYDLLVRCFGQVNPRCWSVLANPLPS